MSSNLAVLKVHLEAPWRGEGRKIFKTFSGKLWGQNCFVIIRRQYLPFTTCWHVHGRCDSNGEKTVAWTKAVASNYTLLMIVNLQLKKNKNISFLKNVDEAILMKNTDEVITANCISSQHLSTCFLIFYVTKWEVCKEHFHCIPK